MVCSASIIFQLRIIAVQLGEYTDCPVFDGLYDFCRIYSGASIDGALRLNQQQTDVAINWSGGLHHAKKSEASGFCYINDIVLAILELLKHHPRVLYIDIDIHHGDGVEEAFYTTDRVMTCSFHKYGDFFPGTGDVRDVGHGPGKGYSVNFPLQEGITDEAYQSVFKPVIAKIMETYKPTAVVLQCGADSLTGDRLGSFNLSLKGHAQCVSFVQSFALPTLVLGGGGYTIRNVARCWAFETSVLLGRELPDAIPPNDYIEFYRPSYKLHLTPSADVTNLNSPSYLHRHLTEILQNLKAIDGAPSVQFQDVPPDWAVLDEDDDTRKLNPDARPLLIDSGPQHEAELYDDDTDQDREQPAVQPAADDDGDVQLSSAPSAAAPPSPPKAGSASAPQQPPTAVVSQAATLTTATSTDSAQAASAEQGAASANGQAMPPAVSAEPEAALPSDSTATAEAKQSVDPEQTGKVAADAAATE